MLKRHFVIMIKKYILNILVTILLSTGLAGVGILLSDVSDRTNIQRYLTAPLLFVLNTIPLLLVMLFLYHLTSRHWVSFGVGGGLYLIMHTINRFMMQLREEPFTPSDLLLGTEAANVVEISELPVSTLIIMCFAFWLIFSIFLFLFVKSEKLKWTARIAGMIIVSGLSAAAFISLYKNTELYNTFKVTGSVYSRVNLFKSRGFMYSYLVRAGTLKSIKPEEYDKMEAQRILSGYQEPPYTVKDQPLPHIIAVMGEAFYDIDRMKGIEFNEGFNPLKNFNRITDQAYSGRIVTSVFGGGTANTEFSFLTGHSLPIMPEMTSPYSFYIRKDTFSLTRELKKAGYETMAFHPGESWFYNRVNVYGFLGFDNKYFKKDMDLSKVEINHGYISDESTAEFALGKFRSHLAEKPGVPFFEFVVNIDNHGPYSKKSLGYPEILKRKDTMEEATYNIINNYLYGLARSDKGLGIFVDSIAKINEPVVFLYFADHLPFLGEKDQGYKALGFEISQEDSLEAYLNHYETPYFIWYNEAAKKLLSNSAITIQTGKAPQISSNYLGTEILKASGINGGSYFNYLEELKNKLPVITSRFYKEDGTFTEKPSSETTTLINQYRDLQYYMLMEKEAILP